MSEGFCRHKHLLMETSLELGSLGHGLNKFSLLRQDIIQNWLHGQLSQNWVGVHWICNWDVMHCQRNISSGNKYTFLASFVALRLYILVLYKQNRFLFFCLSFSPIHHIQRLYIRLWRSRERVRKVAGWLRGKSPPNRLFPSRSRCRKSLSYV